MDNVRGSCRGLHGPNGVFYGAYTSPNFLGGDEFKRNDMDGENVLYEGKEKCLQELWWGNPKIRFT